MILSIVNFDFWQPKLFIRYNFKLVIKPKNKSYREIPSKEQKILQRNKTTTPDKHISIKIINGFN